MKIEFDISQDFYDIRDAVFVALLKSELSRVKESKDSAWHEDDKKLNKKVIKAIKVMLDYYAADC